MATNSLHIVNHARAEFHVLLMKHGKGQKNYILHFFKFTLNSWTKQETNLIFKLISIIFIFVESLTEYK